MIVNKVKWMRCIVRDSSILNYKESLSRVLKSKRTAKAIAMAIAEFGKAEE